MMLFGKNVDLNRGIVRNDMVNEKLILCLVDVQDLMKIQIKILEE